MRHFDIRWTQQRSPRAAWRRIAAMLVAVFVTGTGLGGALGPAIGAEGPPPDAADPFRPPPAPSRPVEETLHGTRLVDPYRNLEDLKAPDTRAWLEAEGRLASDRLARIDGRDALLQRIQALGAATGDAVRDLHRLPHGRLVYLLRSPGENQFRLVVRDGLEHAPRTLVDLQALTRATGVPHAINYVVPSWDGRRVAYGISAGGSENASLVVVDVATGRPLGTPIPRVQEGVHWTPDSRSLSLAQLRLLPADSPSTETYLDSTVYLLTPGRNGGRPEPVFGRLASPGLGLARLDVGELLFAPGSRWMIARTTDTTSPEGRIFVAERAALARPGSIRWRPVATAADKITALQLVGDTLYLRSYAGAPRGRVLALGLPDATLAEAVEAVPEPVDGVLESFAHVAGALHAEVRAGFHTRIRRFAPGGPADGVDIAPGLAGSISLLSSADDPPQLDVWVRTATWTAWPRIVAVAASAAPADTGLLTDRPLADVPPIQATDVRVAAPDGAQIPMTILHRRGLALDGARPTLLDGYGAYGFSIDTGFNPRTLAWLERGGVIALANVRGSGAFGDAWHRAGFKASKPNTWNDGIACARYLIASGYASPATLGIWGTSAGGIFVGRAVTTAPELFAAAIFEVGLLDTVRAEESANGITNISEFGTAKDPDDFRALLEMSTYQHVQEGVDYPAVLLIHGLNDPRVDVWHSAKTAARLQAANPRGRPVLLRLDGQAGHGVGSTAAQGDAKLADIYAFLLWRFGMAGSRSP